MLCIYLFYFTLLCLCILTFIYSYIFSLSIKHFFLNFILVFIPLYISSFNFLFYYRLILFSNSPMTPDSNISTTSRWTGANVCTVMVPSGWILMILVMHHDHVSLVPLLGLLQVGFCWSYFFTSPENIVKINALLYFCGIKGSDTSLSGGLYTFFVADSLLQPSYHIDIFVKLLRQGYL